MKGVVHELIVVVKAHDKRPAGPQGRELAQLQATLDRPLAHAGRSARRQLHAILDLTDVCHELG